MLERILVAVDGSEAAAAVLAAVAAVAKSDETEVLVVHVTDRGRLLRSVHGPDSLTLQWETPPAAKALVDDAVSALRAAGVKAAAQVYGQFDTVARELLDAARASGCGLLAMGTRGRGRVSGPLLGSVAHRVIHLADIPVLIAPPASSATPPRLTRILLAVDGSVASRRAVEAAAETARRTAAHVVVVHVCEPHRASWQRYAAGGVVVEQDVPATADALVDEVVLALQVRGVPATATVRAATGNVAKDILDVAVLHESELIVVGSRGRGAIPALMLGSTTYQLLHSAQVPVLVAR